MRTTCHGRRNRQPDRLPHGHHFERTCRKPREYLQDGGTPAECCRFRVTGFPIENGNRDPAHDEWKGHGVTIPVLTERRATLLVDGLSRVQDDGRCRPNGVAKHARLGQWNVDRLRLCQRPKARRSPAFQPTVANDHQGGPIELASGRVEQEIQSLGEGASAIDASNALGKRLRTHRLGASSVSRSLFRLPANHVDLRFDGTHAAFGVGAATGFHRNPAFELGDPRVQLLLRGRRTIRRIPPDVRNFRFGPLLQSDDFGVGCLLQIRQPPLPPRRFLERGVMEGFDVRRSAVPDAHEFGCGLITRVSPCGFGRFRCGARAVGFGGAHELVGSRAQLGLEPAPELGNGSIDCSANGFLERHGLCRLYDLPLNSCR